MSRARLLLHLAALVLPVLAIGGIRLADPSFERGAVWMTVAAIAAAQIAVACGAAWLLRHASSPWGPSFGGLALGLATHALFGPLVALTSPLTGQSFDLAGLIVGAPAMSLVSAILVGWISLPATVATCVLAARLHRWELAHAAA